VSSGTPAPAAHDNVGMALLLLGMAEAGGADARRLARDAGLPGWLLGLEGGMAPSHQNARLWELTAHALHDPCLGIAAVSRLQAGKMGLYDYLFTTAGTVREALQASGEFFHLVSTNCLLQSAMSEREEVTYSYRHLMPGGRGEELWTQFSIAAIFARIQAVAGRRLIPAHVAFAQPPPRSHREFAEALGTRQIDFGAPATTFTLRPQDLDLRVPTADPVLAGILRRYVVTLAPPRPADWLGHFRQVLSDTLKDGAPSLDAVALRLAVSARTLQRRLAEHGTTWRAELQAVRHQRAEQALHNGSASMSRLARELGYADPRSVRRALRRRVHLDQPHHR
jgi:AraC-like DNA-binding protein